MSETMIRGDSYCRLLVRIFMATAVSAKALFTADLSESNTYYLIQKAIQNKHIRKMTYKEHSIDRMRQYHYYTITAKGIKYLAEQTTYPWLKYLPTDLTSVCIFPASRKGSEVSFATKCGDSAVFALNAGAAFSDYMFSGQINDVAAPETEPDTGRNDQTDWEYCDKAPDDLELADADKPTGIKYVSKTLMQIKQEVFRQIKAEGADQQDPVASDIMFYPVREMRLRLCNNIKDAARQPDFRYGKYTGILTTPVMSVLLYHDEHDGFKWIDRMGEVDRNTLCAFGRYCTPYKNVVQGNLRAGILVSNAASFASIITDKHKKRKPNTVIGRTFNSVYLLPLSPNGAALFNWISTNPQNAKEAYADLAVSKKLDVRPNTDGRRVAFRLVSSAGYLFDGYEMDYRLILHAINLKQENPRLTFKVICFAWQEEFYRKLWPDVGTVTID